MGWHDEIMGAAESAHMGTFGESASYIPPRGSASTSTVSLLFVIIGHEQNERRVTNEGIVIDRVRFFEMDIRSDSHEFCGLTEPQRRGTLIYAGASYAIEVIETNTKTGKAIAKGRKIDVSQAAVEGFRGDAR